MLKKNIKEEFNKYIRKRFPSTSGAATSYARAISCVLDYLKIDSFEKATLQIDTIRMFAYSPKNVDMFLKNYPNFKIGSSYIEKGWITAGIKHFELFYELQLKQKFAIDEKFIKDTVKQYNEIDLENIINFKDEASVKTISREIKERVLNRSIISNLKKFYNYRCQICEKKFYDPYHIDICEGHHINHFVKSLDNSPDNIIILCPNHHRVMHTAEPTLDRDKWQFLYQNNYIEKIRLRDHFTK